MFKSPIDIPFSLNTSFMDSFGKTKYHAIPVDLEKKSHTDTEPGRIECPGCRSKLLPEDLDASYRVCTSCGHHFPLDARARIALLVDDGSFQEINPGLYSSNILDFARYDEKLAAASADTGLNEAIVTGLARLDGAPFVLGAMDSGFMMASMGSVVGEKVVRAGETAIEQKLPLVFCVASGGARMQEGMVALMQMAKTSAIINKVHNNGLLFIAVLTHPTTGGVLASFPSLADIIIAEPGALIGFTGPRVIEQTIKQKLPETFQRSEFLLEHGMLDMVVERQHMKSTLQTIFKLHQGGPYGTQAV